MKHLFIALVTAVGCGFSACHNNEIRHEGMTEEQRETAVRDIHVALSEWYMHQIFAADYLERHFDVQFGAMSNKRSPSSVISEQQQKIALIRGEIPGKEVHQTDLKLWYESQLDAANVLRKQLKKPALDRKAGLNPDALLKLQLVDWEDIKQEVAKLYGVDPRNARAWLVKQGYD